MTTKKKLIKIEGYVFEISQFLEFVVTLLASVFFLFYFEHDTADVKTFNNSRYKWCNGRLPEPTITERYQNWWRYYEVLFINYNTIRIKKNLVYSATCSFGLSDLTTRC